MPKYKLKEKFKGEILSEKLALGESITSGAFSCFIGELDSQYVCTIPSLNISGYGKTDAEAIESMEHNLDTFLQAFHSLKPKARLTELNYLGWKFSKLFKKRFESYVDKKEILVDFENPEEVKYYLLELS